MKRRQIVASVALLLLCAAIALVAISDYDDEKRRRDFARAVVAAMELTAEGAEALERRLELDDHDLQARAQLVVYYYYQAYVHHPTRLRDAGRDLAIHPEHAREHRDHLLWFIRNAPEAFIHGYGAAQIIPFVNADGYVAGKRAWLIQLEHDPTNLALLGNAAWFLSEMQDRDLLRGILKRGQTLDPENSKWPRNLGHMYLRGARFGYGFKGFELAGDPDVPSDLADLVVPDPTQGPEGSALMAMELFQQAYELAADDERASLLGYMAEAGFHAHRYQDARAFATAMLSGEHRDAISAWRIHRANTLLGRLALIDDDVAQAKHYLQEAGKVAASPSLEGYDPEVSLAAELLERGETDAVLAYLELWSKYWPTDELAEWTALVKVGRTPDWVY